MVSALFNADLVAANEKESREDDLVSVKTSKSVFQVVYTADELPNSGNIVDLCRKLLKALSNMKPHKDDLQASGAYTDCVVAGLKRMGRIQPLSVAKTLPGVFLLLADDLLSTKPQIVKKTVRQLKGLLEGCITPALISQSIGNQTSERSCLELLLSHLEGLLSYRYKLVWNHVFEILAAAFRALGKVDGAHVLASRLLKVMLGLRDAEQAEDYEGTLKNAFGAAISGLGAEGVLGVVTLTPDKSNAAAVVREGRWWLLPILKNNLRNPRLFPSLDFSEHDVHCYL